MTDLRLKDSGIRSSYESELEEMILKSSKEAKCPEASAQIPNMYSTNERFYHQTDKSSC